MTVRKFRDREDQEWSARLADDGALVFDSGRHQRRLPFAPSHWDLLPICKLEQMCAVAEGIADGAGTSEIAQSELIEREAPASVTVERAIQAAAGAALGAPHAEPDPLAAAVRAYTQFQRRPSGSSFQG